MKCPNQNSDGSRVAVVPSTAQGGWRGRLGHAGIVKILSNTRFRLDDRVQTPEGWMAYWDVRRTESKRIVPLVCNVCAGVPDKITLSNLVSQTKSSARCACTSRPKHGTLEGRARVEEAVRARGYDLALSASEWVEAHLQRGEAWKFIELRCVACQTPRHVVVSRGASSYANVRRCACTRATAEDEGKAAEGEGEAAEAAEGEGEECAQ